MPHLLVGTNNTILFEVDLIQEGIKKYGTNETFRRRFIFSPKFFFKLINFFKVFYSFILERPESQASSALTAQSQTWGSSSPTERESITQAKVKSELNHLSYPGDPRRFKPAEILK